MNVSSMSPRKAYAGTGLAGKPLSKKSLSRMLRGHTSSQHGVVCELVMRRETQIAWPIPRNGAGEPFAQCAQVRTRKWKGRKEKKKSCQEGGTFNSGLSLFALGLITDSVIG